GRPAHGRTLLPVLHRVLDVQQAAQPQFHAGCVRCGDGADLHLRLDRLGPQGAGAQALLLAGPGHLLPDLHGAAGVLPEAEPAGEGAGKGDTLMKKLLLIAVLALVPAVASAEGGLMKAEVNLNNTASLQRGAKYFANYCMGCHS